MKKQNKFVKPPQERGGGWVVAVCVGRGPLAPEVETYKAVTREAAYQTYRQVKKDLGQGY